MTKNPKKTISLLMIGSIILVIAIIALLVYSAIKNKNDDGKPDVVIDKKTGQTVDGELLKVYQMEEAERIYYYFNQYIKCIENKEYETAYNMLDPKFKNNYFQTLESFTKYVQGKYGAIISVNYEDLNRFGNYYILKVNFIDVFSVTEEDTEVGKEQKFIFNETNYNEYTMSFQAE